jgi:hypothetical protein
MLSPKGEVQIEANHQRQKAPAQPPWFEAGGGGPANYTLDRHALQARRALRARRQSGKAQKNGKPAV